MGQAVAQHRIAHGNRMARNRKSQSAALRFGPALKAAVLCLLIGGTGVGYVWQKEQLVRLSEQKKQREIRLDKLRRNNDALCRQLSALNSVQSLEQHIKDFKLALVVPERTQVVYLPEPGLELPEIKMNTNTARQFASQNSGYTTP
jgi:hypothetical protein